MLGLKQLESFLRTLALEAYFKYYYISTYARLQFLAVVYSPRHNEATTSQYETSGIFPQSLVAGGHLICF